MNGHTLGWMCVQYSASYKGFLCKADITWSSHLLSSLLWLFLSLFLISALILILCFILNSPVVPHVVAQVLSPGNPGEPQSNLSLYAWEGPSVLRLCVCGENSTCTRRLFFCMLHESPVRVIRRYLRGLAGHLLAADGGGERMVERGTKNDRERWQSRG